MSQPARLPINCVQVPERCLDLTPTMRVAVLRSGSHAAFCVVQRVTRQYVKVELFSDVLEGERVSLHAGDRWRANGKVATCKRGVARIELESRLDTATFMGLSAHNDPDRRRSLPRIEAAALVRLTLNRRTVAARLHNISATGARIRASRALLPGAPILLTLPDYGDIRGFVCWSNLEEAGLRFDAPIPVDALAAWLSSRTRVSYRD